MLLAKDHDTPAQLAPYQNSFEIKIKSGIEIV